MKQVLEGVVISAGGASSGGKVWDHVLFFTPWRVDGGPLSKKDLRVLMPAKSKRALAAMNKWVGKTVRVSVTQFEPHSKQTPFGFALAAPPFKAVKADASTTAAAAERNKPRSVTSKVFGVLSYEPDLSWLSTERDGYQLSISVDDIDDEKAVSRRVAKAEAAVNRVESKPASLFKAASSKLLKLYNDTWRDEDAPRLSATQFMKRLSLNAIMVDEGVTTVLINADEMFTDHVIELRLSSTGGVREVGLAG